MIAEIVKREISKVVHFVTQKVISCTLQVVRHPKFRVFSKMVGNSLMVWHSLSGQAEEGSYIKPFLYNEKQIHSKGSPFSRYGSSW